MAKRMCLLTGYETNCKYDCFNCDCGGKEATKDMYVSINNVQRVCSITGGSADTDEGEYVAEVIRNNLERMIDADVQPVKHGEWLINPNISHEPFCSECKETPCYRSSLPKFCPNCGAKMMKDGDTE